VAAVADLPPGDPCAQAPLGTARLTVRKVAVAPGFSRWQARAEITLSAADPAIHPDLSSGEDAWVVVRARGRRAIYPMLLNGVVDRDHVATLVSGTDAEVDEILRSSGVPATALTGAIYLDLDGGGYRAPFGPE
jgi:hypothetical protein